MPRRPAVYILTSRRDGPLYVGVTSDLVRRTWQHRTDALDGFTRRYLLHTLVYYEMHADMRAAITREKQIERWNRARKIQLIERQNPEWRAPWPTLG